MMKQLKEGDLLWRPSSQVVENANQTHYMRCLAAEKNLDFDSY